MASDATAPALNQVLVEALLNGRYHADREGHLDRLHRAIIFGVIVLGASALVEQLPAWARSASAVATAVLGAFDLVFALVERARNHALLRERYFDVAASLQEPCASIFGAKKVLMHLSGKEEPPYFAVHALAENWATCAVYGAEARIPCHVNWWRRRLRHWLRQDGASFVARK